MTVLIATVVGFLAGRMLWLLLRKSWTQPALMRENYQQASLPTAAGITFVLALVVIEGLWAIFDAFDIGGVTGSNAARVGALVVVLGFTLLGLVDDLAGSSARKGFGGHMRALARGELTTGGVKALGGIGVAFVAASFISNDGGLALVIDAAIIALAANLVNLFDLRPGRATKVSLLVFAFMALASKFDAQLFGVAIVIGAAAALILDDMRERLMIGDTGANAMGAALGFGLVSVTASTGRLVTVAVLLALNLLSEFVSFSKIIDSVGPLRSLDRMGRREPTTIDIRESADFPEPRTTSNATPGTSMGGAHVGASAGSHSFRERSPFPSPESRERPATRPFPVDDAAPITEERPPGSGSRSPFGDD